MFSERSILYVIYIISEDIVFSRMLELEIKSISSSFIMVISSISEAKNNWDLMVIDADTEEELNITELQKRGPVICFSRNTKPYKSTVFFKRPFLISDFLKTVNGILKINSRIRFTEYL